MKTPKPTKKLKTAAVQEAHQYTAHIDIIGKGKSEIGERFVKLGINGDDGYVVEYVRTDNLTNKSEAISALNRVGAHQCAATIRMAPDDN